MLKKILLLLIVINIGATDFTIAQELYFSISGKNAKVESGEKTGLYDLWIRPSRTDTLVQPRFEIYDAGMGGFADVVRGAPNTVTSFSLIPFDQVYSQSGLFVIATDFTDSVENKMDVKAEQKYLNRWVEVLTVSDSSKTGWILRVETDSGDDVNNFKVRFTNGTEAFYDLIALDLSIGLYKTTSTNEIQIQPLFGKVEPPSIVVAGEEDTEVSIHDAFGSILSDSNRFENEKFGLKNSWALVLTGSKQRLNNLNVNGRDGIIPWIFNPLIKQNNTITKPEFVAISGEDCAVFDFEVKANTYEADASKTIWLIENKTYTGAKIKHTFATKGLAQVRFITPIEGNYTPLYDVTTESVLINQRPIIGLNSFKKIVSPSEPVLMDASSSRDPENSDLSYSWFVDGVFRGSTEKLSFATSTSGEYEIKLLVNDGTVGSACAISDTVFTIRVNTQPYAEIELEEIVAQGIQSEIKAVSLFDSDNDKLRFQWSVQGLIGNADKESILIDNSKAGIFEAQLIVNDQSGTNNAFFETKRTFKVNSAPIPDFDLISIAAPGQKIQLIARPSVDADNDKLTFSWQISNGITSNENQWTYAFDTPGDYTISLTANDGQGVSNSIQKITKDIRINESPIPVITSVDQSNEAEITFSAAQSQEAGHKIEAYSWDFGDGNQSTEMNPVHVYQKFGTYTIKLTVDDGQGLSNSKQTTEKTLKINRNPIAKFTAPKRVAPNEKFTLDASESTDSDGEIVDFNWFVQDKLVGRGDLFEYSIKEPGTYTIRLSVKDDSGFENATGSTAKIIQVNEAPAFQWTAIPAVTEPNLSTTFRASALSNQKEDKKRTYTWDFGNGATYKGAEIQHLFNSPGTFSFKLTADDGNEMNNSKTTVQGEIRVNASPLIVTEPKITSNSQFITLDASKSYDVDGSPLAFTWILPDGTKNHHPQWVWQAPQGGYFKVGLTIDDQENLDNSRVSTGIDIFVNRPVVAIVDSLIESCTGQIVVFSSALSYDPDGDQFSTEWDFGDGNTSRDNNPFHTYDSPGIYNVKLSLSDGISEQPTIANIPVHISGSPTARMNFRDTVICVNTPITFDGTASTDPNGTIGSYSWDFGDGITGIGSKATHLFNKPGNYTVQLTIVGSDIGTCSNTSTVSANVTVVEGPSATFNIPEWIDLGIAQTLDASASILNGKAKSFQWFITYSDSTEIKLEGIRTSFTPTKAGKVNIKLLVEVESDTDCNSSFVEKNTKVNFAPEIAWNVREVYPDDELIRMRATGTKDLDGFITSYEWTLNGNKVGDTFEAQLGFLKPGIYQLDLNVTDNSGIPSGRVKKSTNFVVSTPVAANFILPEKTFKGETIQLKPQFTSDSSGKELQSKWFVDEKLFNDSSLSFKATNPFYKIKLVQNNGEKLSNAQDSVVKVLEVIQPPNLNIDLPKRITQDFEIDVNKMGVDKNIFIHNGTESTKNWSADTTKTYSLKWVWIPRDTVLASFDKNVEVLPPLAVKDSIKTIQTKWNGVNPFLKLNIPKLNRPDTNDLQIEWHQGKTLVGLGSEIIAPIIKGLNTFTITVTEDRVTGSKPVIFEIKVNAE